jgi:carboxyl-terminal processing protease
MSLRPCAAALGLLLAVACGEHAPPAGISGPSSGTPAAPMSDAVRTYLDRIVTIMQTNSIKRLTIDWTNFRSTVFNTTPSAQTVADAVPAIRMALTLLGDGHSSYMAANGQVVYVPNRSCTASSGALPELPTDVGYIKVGAFSGSSAAATDFATTIQGTIASRDRDNLIGWIVDLRQNGGGNMWPMIAGLGPIVGEDTLGFFIDPTGAKSVWGYRTGASWNNAFTVQAVAAPYTLKRPRPKVAVLVDNGVASSGEATYIAFRQRPNTRSFGTATCGLSTANVDFSLSDGALLNLTVSVMADRTGTPYGDSIAPDEGFVSTIDAAQRAVAWLRGAP